MPDISYDKFPIVIKTFQYLEPLLAKELEELGAENITIGKRQVQCTGSKELVYKANLYLRTGLRVLVPLHTYKAENPVELYDGAKKIAWDKLINLKQTFAIDSTANSRIFTHSHYAGLKVKDAIVDQYREKRRKRPSIDTQKPDIKVNLHIAEDTVTISLDSSGESLHRRGYRLSKNAAPLNEVLAAGMIGFSGWEGESHFVDPMCGSGTLLIEAALKAYQIAPGTLRKKFTFMNWHDYEEDLWGEFKQKAKEKEKDDIGIDVLGGDIDTKSISISRENSVRAGLSGRIRLRHKNFSRLKAPGNPGMMITNPPYGERLKPEDIFELYQMMGDRLKQEFSGYTAWILSSNKDALKKIGLKADKRMELINGSLHCKFHQYSLYQGSKREDVTPQSAGI
ncbi:MAG: THUMP domain-containing protein [Bacteroidota bacterium]